MKLRSIHNVYNVKAVDVSEALGPRRVLTKLVVSAAEKLVRDVANEPKSSGKKPVQRRSSRDVIVSSHVGVGPK